MMFKYFICFIELLLLFNLRIIGQQQPLYSQFDNNKYTFNPAVAGAEIVSTVHITAYEQWLGFKDAPRYLTASFDSRILSKDRKPRRNIRKKLKLMRPENVGAGVQVFNEKYGPLSHTGIAGTYTYHLKFDENRLSFGLSSVFSNYGMNSSDLVLSDEIPDQLLEGDKTRRWMVDFDFGVHLSGKNYFAGYSIHQLSNSVLQWGGSIDDNYQLDRFHYLMAGYTYLISPKVELKPSTLLKLSSSQKYQWDLNLKCIFSGLYWGGLSYKTSKTLSIFLGLQYDRYLFSYSFDYSLTPIRTFSYGSHEIHLAVRLGSETSQYKWLNSY